MPASRPTFSRYRGPISSADYTDRVQRATEDLLRLYGVTSDLRRDQERAFRALVAEYLALGDKVIDLEDRVAALEDSSPRVITFFDGSVDDTHIFDGTAFEVAATERLTLHPSYSLVTLPKVDEASSSKIKVNVGDFVEVMPGVNSVVRSAGGSDTGDNVVFSGMVTDGFLGDPSRLWERVVSSNSAADASVQVYLSVPTLGDGRVNNIRIHPHPLHSVDVMSIEYSTKPDPLLVESDTYTALPAHYSDPRSIGYVPPSTGTEALESGPRSYYFNPTQVTAVRMTLRQRNYFQQDSKFIYEYGLRMFDVRFDKFGKSGKALIRVDAPAGGTISEVTDVSPKTYNVASSQVDDVVSYRTIYETSPGSGVYQTTPVAFSKRVWIELTLSEVSDGYTPAVSMLEVTYT